ncbi:hypothetical protein DVR12_27045 [Chitinophaga silvatica]|uniref:Uncharacterized protein n=1 Tax=Chitinophaga silvatica TaxID=2282649 RepID=A0A3E1Y1Z4_9BACT|nr:hypothetical protein [Chitinophaga silvatica]RFS18705.1 hypothetical protein DVR12_27045 [Chitinophaga silvatica]
MQTIFDITIESFIMIVLKVPGAFVRWLGGRFKRSFKDILVDDSSINELLSISMIIAVVLLASCGNKSGSDKQHNSGTDSIVYVDFGYGKIDYSKTELDSMKEFSNIFSYDLITRRKYLKSVSISTLENADTIIKIRNYTIYCSIDPIHNSYSFGTEKSNSLAKNTLYLNGRQYHLDSLYGKVDLLGNENIYISAFYTFTFLNECYLLIFCSPQVTNSAFVPHKGFLIRFFHNNNAIITEFPGYQYSNSNYCISSLDENNSINYIRFAPELNKVIFYKYNDDKFLVDSSRNLTIQPYLNEWYKIDR